MKKFLLIILMFSVSCSNQNSEEDGDLLNDKDNDIAETEEIQDDDFYSPACLDDWEKLDVVEDVKELFDFEVKVKSGKGEWKEDVYGEFVDFDGEPTRVLGKMKDGSLVLSESYEYKTEDGHPFLIIINPDNSYKRFIIDIEADEEINFGMGDSFSTPFKLWIGYGFDAEKEEVFITVTAKSRIESNVEGKYFARPLLIKIDRDGNFSYKAWKYNGNTVCSNIFKKNGRLFLFCNHWSTDPEIYLATGRINAEINVINGNRVFRKILYTDFSAISNFMVSEEEGKIYTSYSENNSGVDPIPNFIYSIDERDLCVETFRPDDFLTNSPISGVIYGGDDYLPGISAFLRKEEYSILAGNRDKWIYEESSSFVNRYATFYFNHPEKDKIFSFGIEDPFFEFGGETKMHFVSPMWVHTQKGSKYVFASLASTFDLEDKGREWITPEVLESVNLPLQPSFVAINIDTDEVFLKHLMVDVFSFNSGMIYGIGDNLYILLTFMKIVDDEYFFERKLYRFKDSWLINEESKAKDTRLWIEEF